MSKFDLKGIASALATAHNISEDDAEKFLKVVCDVVLDALRHDGLVKIKGLGTFKLIGVPEREMVDVNTGERITVEARNRISFSPDAVLRDIINKPFVLFDTVVLNEGVVFDDETENDSSEEDEEQFGDDSLKEEESDTEEVTDEPGAIEESSDASDYADDNKNEESEKTENDAVETDEKINEDVVSEEESGDGQSEEETSVEIPADDEVGEDVIDSDKQEESATELENSDTDQISAELQEEPLSESEPAEDSQSSDDAEIEVEEDDTTRQSDVPQAVNDALEDARSVMDDIESGNTDDEEYGFYDEEGNFFTRNILNIFIVFAVIVGAAAVIYGFYGNEITRYLGFGDEEGYMPDGVVMVDDSTNVVKDTIIADSVVRDTLNADSVKTKAKTELVKKDTIDSDFYESLDVRVRTGAYRIVGISDTVIVRKGQTFKSITRAYLGEGMECYMEVLNGVKSAEPGDTLKIPKLKWKKKRKK